jgi:hypothetical protein
MFGRPPRDTGLESERNNRAAADQRLHLLNSSHIQLKLEQSPLLRYYGQANKTPGDTVLGLYLSILSRYPTPAELKIVEGELQAAGGKRQAMTDLAWALVNSSEFLYRH